MFAFSSIKSELECGNVSMYGLASAATSLALAANGDSNIGPQTAGRRL